MIFVLLYTMSHYGVHYAYLKQRYNTIQYTFISYSQEGFSELIYKICQ